MKKHNVKRCDQTCWAVFSATQRLKGQEPAAYFAHHCDVHDAQLGGYCKACELALEPPRTQRLPAKGHGMVACGPCQQIVLTCPLGESMADDHLDERLRHPAAVGA